jgi:hypothetical protein
MKITHRSVIGLALLALGAFGGFATVTAQSAHVVVPADKVQWGPAPPFLPPGAQISVLAGDPHQKGDVALRLKFPANYEIPAHWHSMTEQVTVMSGMFHIGMGDKLDRKNTQTLAPGGFVSLPGNMRHFAWTSAPTVVQLNLQGPFDIFYVNPADNPQKSNSTR